MSNRPKPQASSKLDKLPQHQLDALERWLFEEKISYDQARSRLFNDFGVRVGSNSTLSSFYQRCADRRMLDRIAERAAKTNAVVKRFEENPADTYNALIGLVGQIAFDKATQDQLDPETIYNFTKLMLANRKEDVREQALSLEKQKFQRDTCGLFLKWAADQRAKEIAGSNESNAAKIERLGQLMFGEDWKQ